MSQRKPAISVRRPPRADIDAFVSSGEAPVAANEQMSDRPSLQVVEDLESPAPESPSVKQAEARTTQTTEPSSVKQAEEPIAQDAEPPATLTVELTSITTSTTRTGIVTRADGRKRRRRTVYLPPTLDKQLAVYCAINEIEASDFVAHALEQVLATAQ